MKELSIEQKARRYDEAIGVINKCETDKYGCLLGVKPTDIFPELKESEDEMVWLTKYLQEEIDCLRYDIRDYKDSAKLDNLQRALAWLERQGEQKPVDKTEPKFHEGDLVTNGKYLWRIIEVKALDYILQSQNGEIVDDTISYVDKEFRSWTIQDAKDGDILAYNDGSLTIFHYRLSGLNAGLYMSYVLLTDKIEIKQTCAINNVHPATKEQRDALMEAMADAGYTFDFGKKELKNIENEIEFPLSAKDSELQEETYFIPKGFHAEIDDDKVVIKKGEKGANGNERETPFSKQILANSAKTCKDGQNPVVVIPKFRVGDVIRPKGSTTEYTIESISGGCYRGNLWRLPIGCDGDYELVEQNPTDKVESKFKIGDRIKPIDSCLGSLRTIKEVCECWYVTNKGILDFEYEDNYELAEQNAIEPDYLIEESYQQQADDLIDMVTENPTWSEEHEIEIPVGAKDSELQEVTYYIPKGFSC